MLKIKKHPNKHPIEEATASSFQYHTDWAWQITPPLCGTCWLTLTGNKMEKLCKRWDGCWGEFFSRVFRACSRPHQRVHYPPYHLLPPSVCVLRLLLPSFPSSPRLIWAYRSSYSPSTRPATLFLSIKLLLLLPLTRQFFINQPPFIFLNLTKGRHGWCWSREEGRVSWSQTLVEQAQTREWLLALQDYPSAPRYIFCQMRLIGMVVEHISPYQQKVLVLTLFWLVLCWFVLWS